MLWKNRWLRFGFAASLERLPISPIVRVLLAPLFFFFCFSQLYASSEQSYLQITSKLFGCHSSETAEIRNSAAGSFFSPVFFKCSPFSSLRIEFIFVPSFQPLANDTLNILTFNAHREGCFFFCSSREIKSTRASINFITLEDLEQIVCLYIFKAYSLMVIFDVQAGIEL